MSRPIEALKTRIRNAASQGINETLDAVLADLVVNAPRRSGTLASRYRISERATPQNTQGAVSNSVGYSGTHYPYRIYSPNRYENGYPSPSLFVPKSSQMGILSRNEVSMERVRALMRSNILKALRER